MGLFNLFKKDKKEENYSNQAIAVFLNWAKNNKPIMESVSDYPRYIEFELGINDPIQLHKYLVNNEYLCKPTIKLLLDNLKVSELKEILESNALQKTGKKSVLIERILNNVPQNILDAIENSYNGFVTSEKGENFISLNHHYIDIHIHSNWMISVDEYESVRKSLKFSASFNDVAWGIFNKRNLSYISQRHWGLVRNNRLNMYELLESENKHKEAFFKLIEVLYYDLSGLSNNDIIDEFNTLILAPGIVKYILKLKNYYDDSLIDMCYSQNPVPFRYFEKENFKIILNDILSSKDIDLKSYKKYVNSR